MSTYQTAELALLTTCKAYNGGLTFTDLNAVTDDWQALDASAGSGGLALVIEMGAETIEGDDLEGRGSQDTYQERHTIKISIAIKIGTAQSGYSALAQTLKSTTEGVKDYIRAHTLLGNTTVIDRCLITRTSPIMSRIPKGQGSPTHYLQWIWCQIWCENEQPANDEGGF